MIKLYVTILGFGFIPLASGTIGSIVGVFSWIALTEIFQPQIILALTIIVFFVSWISTEIYVRQKNDNEHDPSEVIIDELIGQWVGLTPILFLHFFHHSPTNTQFTILIFISFLLFRFFDIVKPWPINVIDRQTNSFSILFDDIVAGFFSSICITIYLSWAYL